jgi:outer membrane protein assembly factor BamA
MNISKRLPEQKAQIQETNTIGFILERDLSRNIKFSWNLWTESATRLWEHDIATTINRKVEEKDIATIGPTIEFDYRDNPYDARKGTFTTLSAEYSDPIFGSSPTVNYIKFTGSFNHYIPIIWQNLIFANSLRGGYVQNVGADPGSEIPQEKQFYLGGSSTLRGFDQRALPPEFDRDGYPRHIKHDSHYYLLKSEIRYPIYGNLKGVFFYDGGTIIITGFPLSDEFRDAAGLGIRYETPVGPVSIEYGYKLDRDKNAEEGEGRFHFSIGTF